MEIDKNILLKTLLTFVLICGSLLITFNTFMDFISGKTTMSFEVVANNKLKMPAITFCRNPPYKNIGKNLKMSDYLENTMKLEDFFISLTGPHSGIENLNFSALNYTIKAINTMYKGRCYTLQVYDEFESIFYQILRIRANISLTAFFHDPGFEIWPIMGYWPKRPKLFKFGDYMGLKDVSLRKTIVKKSENCTNDINYNIRGTDSTKINRPGHNIHMY